MGFEDEPRATYSVVLRSGIPALERQLLEQFCCQLTSSQGESLLEFHCTQIDVSHHRYIELKTFRPPGTEVSTLLVPHEFVLLIDGSKQRPPIGFAGIPPTP